LYAGIVMACLGVALLVIAVIALRSPNGSGTATGKNTVTRSAPKSAPKSAPRSTPATASATSTSAPPAAGKPALLVLNSTHITGLAERAKARFEAGGWSVTSTGDLTNDILSTCAYYDPGDPAARAAALALQAQFPAIKRVAARFAELPPAPIVVVLTSDYS